MCWIRCNGLINGLLGYFEWDRSETIFGNFSENVVQGSMGQGETRQEEVKVEAQPPTQKIESS